MVLSIADAINKLRELEQNGTKNISIFFVKDNEIEELIEDIHYRPSNDTLVNEMLEWVDSDIQQMFKRYDENLDATIDRKLKDVFLY